MNFFLKNISLKKIIVIIIILLLFIIYNVKFSKNIPNHLNINDKYVIYECIDDNGWLCGGWADRLKGIMSAYAWALLTNRKLILDVTKPCSLTNFYIPNKIQWNQDIKKIFELNNIKNKSSQFKIWQWGGMKYEMSDWKLEQFNPNSTIVYIRNNIDWLDPFAKNKHIKNRLVELGFDIDKFQMQFLFKKWFDNLFKLNKTLEIKYSNYLKRMKPNNNVKLVCAQIRTEFLKEETVKLFWDYIRYNFTHNISDFNIFLTTDSPKVELAAIKEFGRKVFIINGTISNIDHTEQKIDPIKIEKAFLDFHMLQNCDMAIISESGFGKLGVWNRIDPNKNLVMVSKELKIVIKNSTKDLFIW